MKFVFKVQNKRHANSNWNDNLETNYMNQSDQKKYNLIYIKYVLLLIVNLLITIPQLAYAAVTITRTSSEQFYIFIHSMYPILQVVELKFCNMPLWGEIRREARSHKNNV